MMKEEKKVGEEKPVSLDPLDPDEALEALLGVSVPADIKVGRKAKEREDDDRERGGS